MDANLWSGRSLGILQRKMIFPWMLINPHVFCVTQSVRQMQVYGFFITLITLNDIKIALKRMLDATLFFSVV